MIILDRALERREREGRPIRVGMVGAGFMGRGIALQITTRDPGHGLVADLEPPPRRRQAGVRRGRASEVQAVDSAGELDDAIARGRPAVTEDPLALCDAEAVDAVIEVTGTVELGARVALRAFEHGKHVVLMNAELDGTVGPILKTYADQAGVVFTNADGDQPGVTMNLYRFVRGIGLKPVLCGNIKGLHDPYRNPTTQEEFRAAGGGRTHRW